MRSSGSASDPAATAETMISRIRCRRPATSGGKPEMYSSTVVAAMADLGRCLRIRQQLQPLPLVAHREGGAVGESLAVHRELAGGGMTEQLADHRAVRDGDDGCRSRRGLAPRVADDIVQGAQSAATQVRPRLRPWHFGTPPIAPPREELLGADALGLAVGPLAQARVHLRDPHAELVRDDLGGLPGTGQVA